MDWKHEKSALWAAKKNSKRRRNCGVSDQKHGNLISNIRDPKVIQEPAEAEIPLEKVTEGWPVGTSGRSR